MKSNRLYRKGNLNLSQAVRFNGLK